MSNRIQGVGTPPTYNLNDIKTYTAPKQSGGFRKFLGAIAGGVANVFAPGLGSILGSAIAGGASVTGGGLGSESMQLLELQKQMMMESRSFQTASNVLKMRHDASMAAIRNMRA